MFRKKYRVKGEYVNDFMKMEDFAYRLYAESIVKAFLIENGCSSNKLKTAKVYLNNCKDQLICRKDLMFTQDFFMNLDSFNLYENEENVNIKTRFFNAKNELCAILVMDNHMQNSLQSFNK